MAAKGRRGSRRLLLQALYQLQISENSSAELAEQFAEQPGYAGADSRYFDTLLAEIVAKSGQLDDEINRSGDIKTELLDPVERAILWISMAELLWQPDVPHKVVINEAIELAKEFGAEGSYRFINGVLDKHVSQSSQAS